MARISFQLSEITKNQVLGPLAPVSVKVPVQSGFTVNVPVLFACATVPLEFVIPTFVVTPAPPKVCMLTWANAGPTGSGAATKYPVVVTENVPMMDAFVHPLSSAFAVGATLSASAVTAAIVKLFAMVLRVMIISFAFDELPPFREDRVVDQAPGTESVSPTTNKESRR
jgi:hypothetical protein